MLALFRDHLNKAEDMDSTERQRIHQSIRIARKQMLDLLQACYGHQGNWNHVRARVLKIMGRTGLESPFLQPNGNTDHTGWNDENK
jgi:hypothetical protein